MKKNKVMEKKAPEPASVLLLGPGVCSKTPGHDEIACAAYLAWERDGRQDGRDDYYWLEAETQLRAGNGGAGSILAVA